MLPLALLAYPADMLISKKLRQSGDFAAGEYAVWNDIFDANIDADIYIYGSSRAWRHLDPKIIGDSLKMKTYNFGIDGHNFPLQLLRHQMLIKRRTPKLIIHSLDMSTFVDLGGFYNREQFLPYLLGNDEIKSGLTNLGAFTNVDYKLPIARFCGHPKVFQELFSQMTFKENFPLRVNGFHANISNWDGSFENIKSSLKTVKVETEPRFVKNFEKYLEECKAMGIRVVFVYTPEFIEGQAFETNRKEIMNFYKSVAQKQNISFFDYMLDPISYDKRCFYNAMHMNKHGTDKFNPKFASKLKEIIDEREKIQDK